MGLLHFLRERVSLHHHLLLVGLRRVWQLHLLRLLIYVWKQVFRSMRLRKFVVNKVSHNFLGVCIVNARSQSILFVLALFFLVFDFNYGVVFLFQLDFTLPFLRRTSHRHLFFIRVFRNSHVVVIIDIMLRLISIVKIILGPRLVWIKRINTHLGFTLLESQNLTRRVLLWSFGTYLVTLIFSALLSRVYKRTSLSCFLSRRVGCTLFVCLLRWAWLWLLCYFAFWVGLCKRRYITVDKTGGGSIDARRTVINMAGSTNFLYFSGYSFLGFEMLHNKISFKLLK